MTTNAAIPPQWEAFCGSLLLLLTLWAAILLAGADEGLDQCGRDPVLWSTRRQLLYGRTLEFFHPFTARICLLILKTQMTSQCSGKICKWEERVWTLEGKSIKHCLIVTAWLLKTSCLMLSLGILRHKGWCHGNTKQHFVKQLEKFAYKGER